MSSANLTTAQCRALQEQLALMLGYLNKLRHRMQNKSFPLDDPLRVLVSQAQETMQTLVTEIRCHAAESGQKRIEPSSD
jgi:hypothetical protein